MLVCRLQYQWQHAQREKRKQKGLPVRSVHRRARVLADRQESRRDPETAIRFTLHKATESDPNDRRLLQQNDREAAEST
jgi:hypothetical protein